MLVGFIPCGVTCSHATAAPLLPSGDEVTLTIRVLVRGPHSTLPIAGAIVRDDRRHEARTDAEGIARLREVCEEPLSVRAEAVGYQGFSAEVDRLTGPETWTFYLERER